MRALRGMTGSYHISNKIETYNFMGVPQVTHIDVRPSSTITIRDSKCYGYPHFRFPLFQTRFSADGRVIYQGHRRQHVP